MIPLILLTLGCTGTDTSCDTASCGDSGTAGSAPVDLLLVIDDSPSMAEEIGAFVNALDILVDELAGRDAQAHVIPIGVEQHAGAHLGGVNLDAAGALEDLQALVSGIGTAGSGTEEGLETVFEATCRAGGEVPAACFDNTSVVTEIEADTSLGLWRDDTDHVALVLSDEGDFSRRLALGDADVTPYLDLFAALEEPVGVTVIGPEIDSSGANRCGAIAETWSTERYINAAAAAGLPFEALTDEEGAGTCDLRVEEALAAIAGAL